MKRLWAGIAVALLLMAAPAWSAQYLEIYGIATGDDGANLRAKITVCAAIKAHAISLEVGPSQTRADWAREALENPQSKVELLLNYLLAADNTLTVGQITGASDAAIQTRCDSAIDDLYP